MSDLISRKTLLNKIYKQFDVPDDWDGDFAEPLQTVIDIIDNLEITYDVDKVVEQLEEFRGELAQFGADGILTDMLEVVRAGGKE